MLDVAVRRKHERGLLALRAPFIIPGDIGGQPAKRAIEIDPPQDIRFESRTGRSGHASGDIAGPLNVGRMVFRGIVDRVVVGEDIAAVCAIHHKAGRGRRVRCSRGPGIQPG